MIAILNGVLFFGSGFLLFGFCVYLIYRWGYKAGWRRARDASPTCPECGYNMSGLTECRCPECGTQHRLDDLWRWRVLYEPPED